MPWIRLNGTDVADSAACIDHLNGHFDVNLDAGLTVREIAIGRAIRALIEEDLYFVMVYCRWIEQCVPLLFIEKIPDQRPKLLVPTKLPLASVSACASDGPSPMSLFGSSPP